MAPKGKGRGDDLKQEDILQAVVIADSFNVKFGPITDEKPRALLPLVNVPMLDYTLDLLASEKVQETFVFCAHKADQIKAHIRNSKWGQPDASMTVKVLLAEGSRSVGDALRVINAQSLIRNDFFLLNCDIITNVNLEGLMKEHRERREKIKSSVMTMTCMKVPPKNSQRCAEDNILLGVEPVSKRICHYQKVSLDSKIGKVPFKKHPDMVVRQDLLDGQLYLCSPMVLHLFTDNFDYCTLEDFIKGIIINEEIFGNTMHVNILEDKYCARITNPYMYDIVSQDIIARRTYPITPSMMVGHRTEVISCCGHNVYKSKGVSVASKACLERNVVIAKGSSVQADCVLSDTVIGQNCRIGAKVRLQNCYVWDNVVIEDNCQLTHAIVCSNVVIYASTIVQPHTILSWNVRVGPDISLPANLRLQDKPQTDDFDDDDDEQDVPDVTPEFGLRSRAFRYMEDSDSDEEGEEPTMDWGRRLITADGDVGGDEEPSSATMSNLGGDDLGDEDDEYTSFYCEVSDTLKRAKDEKIKTENLILEVNSLKHAYNIAIKDVHCALVKVLVEVPLNNNPTTAGKELMAAVLRHVETHKGLLQHYIKHKDAQWDCMHTLEDFAVEDGRVLSLLPKVVQHLYNVDVLEEQVILQWFHTKADEDEEEEHQRVRKPMEAFINWLEEAEEESDDD